MVERRKNPISCEMEYYYFCYWYCSYDRIGAILPDIQGTRKILYHFFSRNCYRRSRKNGKKLKYVSMKRIVELILFKCDKHLIRMQSPLPLPPPFNSTHSWLTLSFGTKNFFCSIFLWMCANIFVWYICLAYRKFNRKKIKKYKYKQKMRPLHSAHTQTLNRKSKSMCFTWSISFVQIILKFHSHTINLKDTYNSHTVKTKRRKNEETKKKWKSFTHTNTQE